LGFGDYDEENKKINDLSVTNNGDSLKVLATVASTIYAFTEKHPNAWILATGSTTIRTRLYRMGITNNLAEIAQDFVVFGCDCYGNWNEFIIGEDYEAFLLTKKENILS
jgi:aconitase A